MPTILVGMAGIVTDPSASAAHWSEPEGLAPRGTLIVVPGRGEEPALYERFGRRLAADAYRVRTTPDPTARAEEAEAEIVRVLADPATAGPVVLVGSDTGALFAAGLVASGRVTGAAALVLAGLPAATPPVLDGSWDAELEARTACPTHQGRLAGPHLRRGALYGRVPDGWAERADLGAVGVPVLGLHGADDAVSPFAGARARYAQAPAAELVGIANGRHDVLNDQTHRTVAATVVLFLERLRLGADLPAIAVREPLGESS